MSEELTLLPCPFCGSRDVEVQGKPAILDALDSVCCNECTADAPHPVWNTRAQLPSLEGEAVEVVGYGFKHVDKGWLFSGKSYHEVNPCLEGFGLMTVAQHQRILAASVGSADHVGVVFTMEALVPGGGVKSHASLNRDLPAGTKLYTHPADKVADDLTMVKVSRELLDQIAVELEHDNDRYLLGRELRALLANNGRGKP